METPIQIEFQGLHASEAVRRTLAEQMGKLEERFGRITAGSWSKVQASITAAVASMRFMFT